VDGSILARGYGVRSDRYGEVAKLLFQAGDMIGEIALAIEMGADAVDIGKTIHPHPTLGESIGMAAEIAHGSCTDVPPARK
jgi:dihydrolipoamide dehydrogenase